MNRPIVEARAKGVERVESGPVQFGKDWPGLFLRGDHAMKIAMCIRQLEKDRAPLSTENARALRFLVELAVMIEQDIDVQPRADKQVGRDGNPAGMM